MSAYNFQKEFAPKILNGTKLSTIRARRKNGYVPTAGEKIRLYIGMRTRSCKLLREVEVSRVRPIAINQYHRPGRSEIEVVLDGARLGISDLVRLAACDGFESVPAFAAFFSHAHGDAFSGYLIEWRP